jgi:hypothetical protein
MRIMSDLMKALTLTQPWASLMAKKAKQIETRSWATHYRGPLVIHASAAFPKAARQLCERAEFYKGLGGKTAADLPRARCLCIVDVIGCFRVEEMYKAEFVMGEKLTAAEAAFGDYSAGRYAWVTRYVTMVDDPGPTEGGQRIWYWLRGGGTREDVRQAVAMRAYDRGETHL